MIELRGVLLLIGTKNNASIYIGNHKNLRIVKIDCTVK